METVIDPRMIGIHSLVQKPVSSSESRAVRVWISQTSRKARLLSAHHFFAQDADSSAHWAIR